MTALLSVKQRERLGDERQSQAIAALRDVLPEHALIWNAEDTTPYECDGLTAYRTRPWLWPYPRLRRRWPPC